eukprot:tig00000042_g15391.t1
MEPPETPADGRAAVQQPMDIAGRPSDDGPREPLGRCSLCAAELYARDLVVECAECLDVRLCFQCFLASKEGAGHKAVHMYTRIENANFPLLSDDWGADEELALLEALERHGIGPWQTVAEEVGTKTWWECERHYAQTYLQGMSAPLPDFEKAFGGIGTPVKPREQQAERPAPLAEQRWDRPRGQQGSKRPSKKPRSHLAQGEEDGCYHPDVRGYMPKRGDFDTEWANDAEVVIQDIAFDPSDGPRDRALKLEVLHAYNAKLTEREFRKTFLIERGLLDLKKQHAAERRRGKDDRDTLVRMKPFARFHAAKEHEALFHGLVEERKLRGEIARLQRYRRLGIRSLAETHAYENDRRKREIEADEKKAKCFMKLGSSSVTQSSGTTSARRSTKGEPLLMLGADADNNKRRKKKGKGPSLPPLALHGLPGEDQLEPEELALCSQLHMLPEQYLLAKDALICADTPTGKCSAADAVKILARRLDAGRATSIHNLLISKGWIE